MEVAWLRLLETLRFVEQSSAGASGVATFDCDSPRGAIFAEDGWVCWAAAEGLSGRLNTLLSERAAIGGEGPRQPPTESGVVGKAPLHAAWLANPGLEDVFRRHSAESLIELCQAEAIPVWSTRQAGRLSARFRFRPMDLIAEIARLQLPEDYERAKSELEQFRGPDRRGAAFLLNPTIGQVVPIHSFSMAVGLKGLEALGATAVWVLGAGLQSGSAPKFAMSSSAGGDGFCVWNRGPIAYVVAAPDPGTLAGVVSQLMSEARGS